RKVLARKTITLTAVSASLSFVDKAAAGDTIRINWEGPDYPSDYIATIKPGDGGNDDITYTYTKEGSPLNLKLPAEPGEYEIVYVQHHGRKVLARENVTTTAVTAKLDIPETSPAASTIRINWEGPDYPSDYIATIKPGDGGNDDITYTYTKEGSPLNLRLPADPGEYEIVYVQHHGRKVLARQTIATTPVNASLESPDSASAGDTIRINWEGPDYPSDYIATIKPGDGGNDDITYTYTKEGSPLNLSLPTEPGDYEIIYVQHHGKKVLARQAVTVTK